MVEFCFATNRNELAPDANGLPTDFGKVFSENGLVELRYGKAKVTGKKADKVAIEVASESMDASLDRAPIVSDTTKGNVDRLGALAVLDGTDSDAVEGRVYLPEKNVFRLEG